MAVALDRMHVPELTAPDAQRPGLPFTFTGRAGEYFGIWIVNLLLSVITLGIYSAWAKVRTNKYFYGNTRLEGSAFDYLASPLQILKGRLLMVAFFAAYSLCSSIAPSLTWLFIVAMVVLTPWAVVSARAFTAHNSSYRNVRFSFDGTIWEATKLYILLPIAGFFTLGGLIPYNAWRGDRFLVNHTSYGQSRMTFDGGAKIYYQAYGVALLCALPAVVLFGSLMLPLIEVVVKEIANIASSAQFLASGYGEHGQRQGIGFSIASDDVSGTPFNGLALMMYLGAIVLWLGGSAYKTMRLQNYLFDRTHVGPHRLRLHLEFLSLLWIRISNLVMIALSIGLMIPWARIRMARYQIERMSLIPDGDLDTLVGEQRKKVGAYGDELGDGMDLDLGLGV